MYNKELPELAYLPADGNGYSSNIMAQQKDFKGNWITLLRRRCPNSRKAYWYELVYRDCSGIKVMGFEGTERGVEDARDSFKLYAEELEDIEHVNNKSLGGSV